MGVEDVLTQVNDLGALPKIGIAIVLVSVSLLFSKYVIIRPWFKLVKKTKKGQPIRFNFSGERCSTYFKTIKYMSHEILNFLS